MLKLKIFSGLIVLTFLIGLITPNSVLAVDLRVKKLEKYLQQMNSPMSGMAEVFVSEADKNGLDYRLLPAIAGMESTFARFYIPGTYNAWGWGGGYIYFKNWRDAISSISAQLTKKPYRGVEVEQIAPIYCPPNYINWTRGVRFFMDKIDKTEIADKPVIALAITL